VNDDAGATATGADPVNVVIEVRKRLNGYLLGLGRLGFR